MEKLTSAKDYFDRKKIKTPILTCVKYIALMFMSAFILETARWATSKNMTCKSDSMTPEFVEGFCSENDNFYKQ